MVQGLRCVTSFLLNKKQGHTRVIWFNLREDLVLECGDGETYSWREASHLDQPLVMPGISSQEIEARLILD